MDAEVTTSLEAAGGQFGAWRSCQGVGGEVSCGEVELRAGVCLLGHLF